MIVTCCRSRFVAQVSEIVCQGARRVKKICIICLMLSMIICTVTACVPSVETITKQPGNYLYSKNEKIEIVDIESNQVIATLKIKDCCVLKNSTFKISEYKNTDSNGSAIYEDVNYEQLIQVDYDFENQPGYSKKISAHNFSVKSRNGSQIKINPEIKDLSFDEANSFLVALKEKSDRLEISFTYDIYQRRDTAKISLNVTDIVDNGNSPFVDAPTVLSTYETASNKDTISSVNDVETASVHSSENQQVSVAHEYLIVVIILLTVALIAVSSALIVKTRTKL